MHKLAIATAAVAFTLGTFAPVGFAHAQVVPPPHPTIAYTQDDGSSPAVPMDCVGTTGGHGCGPGWFWRDGWRGWGCYPC